MKKDRVLILFDTDSPTVLDQDYSEELKSVDWETEKFVTQGLTKLNIPFTLLGLYDNIHLITEKVAQFRPTVIFNLADRYRGQGRFDRDIASFLKLTGLPYTGCGPTGMTLCKDKALAKKILGFHRIDIPQFQIFRKNRTKPLLKRMRFPLIVKPLGEESSSGISQASYVETLDQLNQRVAFVHLNFNQDALVEEYIEGREIYISLLGNNRVEVFPPREMVFKEVPEDEPRLASYKSKWDEKYRKKWGIQNRAVTDLDANALALIKKKCRKIYSLLGIDGYARFDMRMRSSGSLAFIEANPNPILSADEDFARSAKKQGYETADLIAKLLKLAKQRHLQSSDSQSSQYFV